jgi:site-specific DNA recombinase
LVAVEVAERLESGKPYGIWWYNRQRVVRRQVAESGPNGRVYRKRGKYSIKDRCEWIAVPVPDAGIPQEVVEAARQTVLDYRPTSKAAGRFWELSGAIMRCALCRRAMNPQKTGYTKRSGEKGHVFYYRCPRAYGYDGECSHRKNHRADKLEPAVWNLVSSLLSDPVRLRGGLERMIEEEKSGVHGDPERETKVWLDKLAEVDHMRSVFQDMAAQGLIVFNELRTKLAGLDETRQLAQRELDFLEERHERLRGLERDKHTLLEHYAGMVPEVLDALTPEERHHIYKMLRLRIVVYPDGTLEVSGTFGDGLELSEYGPTPGNGVSSNARSSPTSGCGGWSRSASLCRDTRSSSTTTSRVSSGT